MLIDWIAATLPLAATDEPSFVGSILSSLMLWGRVALGIGLVIFVHELGHFVAAKSFGVKCEKFYVGFDVPIKIGPIKFPRTLGKFRYGETEYGIGIIPLGGYVKMLGQDDDPRKLEEENKRIQVEDDLADQPALDPRSFPAKPVWQRMIIISAGVIVNVITGILFAAIAFGYGVGYSPAVVGGVSPGGPAWQAGIEPGGKVVGIGSLEDDNMHFRDMRMEILTQGLSQPDQPIDVAIEYADGVRHFKLRPAALPENKDMRMIGVTMPSSVTLAKEGFASEQTAASTVLNDADAGATVVAYNGTDIDAGAIAPGTEFLSFLYTHPADPITLTLRRSDGSNHDVTLPPQKSKSIGFRYAVGPIVAVVAEGPADKAGLKVGDVIESVGENENPDAFGMLTDLVGGTGPIQLSVKRTEGEETNTVTLTLAPVASPQTLPPTTSITGEIAINAYGFAYRPLTEIVGASAFVGADSDENEETKPDVLRAGDRLQEVRMLMSEEETPAWLKEERYARILKILRSGWKFSYETPLNTFNEAVQFLPVGTKFEVFATRPPEDRVVSTTVAIGQDDRFEFDRGLRFPTGEAVHKAESVSEALSLGLREGKRRLMDVVRFLDMLVHGRLNLKHVGGPVAIVDIAKSEAEKGMSAQLMFLTMLSMNLAILNFLPIPALDGGHMMFLLYELIVGKRANEQLEFRLTVAGLLSLLLLMVVVFANDIMRYLN